MLSLFAHHAEAFFKVEIGGRDFPEGDAMGEHVVFVAVIAAVLILMSYGIFAGIRDFIRWRRRPAAAEVKAS